MKDTLEDTAALEKKSKLLPEQLSLIEQNKEAAKRRRLEKYADSIPEVRQPVKEGRFITRKSQSLNPVIEEPCIYSSYRPL